MQCGTKILSIARMAAANDADDAFLSAAQVEPCSGECHWKKWKALSRCIPCITSDESPGIAARKLLDLTVSTLDYSFL